jgi:hypothetical protein
VAALLWLIQVLIAVEAVLSVTPYNTWLPWTKNDFNHYYLTSERVVRSSSEVYCLPFSQDEKSTSGLRSANTREPTNPPLLTAALAPLAYIPPGWSWGIYMFLSLSTLLTCWWLFIKKCLSDSQTRDQRALLLAVAVSPPMISLICYSQIQGFLLALCLGSFALLGTRPTLSGFLLGAAIALKGLVAPLLTFLFLTRRYRVLSVAFSIAILGVFLPGYIDRRLDVSEYARCGLFHVEEWSSALGNQSMSGILRTMAELVLVPRGIVDMHTLSLFVRGSGAVLWLFSAVIMGLLTSRRLDFREGFFASLALCVICAPMAWAHYYILVWPYLITVWSKIPNGSKLTLWLSMPFMPGFITAGPHSWTDIILNPPGALLPWLPGSIFIVQVLAVMWTYTVRPSFYRLKLTGH